MCQPSHSHASTHCRQSKSKLCYLTMSEKQTKIRFLLVFFYTLYFNFFFTQGHDTVKEKKLLGIFLQFVCVVLICIKHMEYSYTDMLYANGSIYFVKAMLPSSGRHW